jgi:hypothetical protein
MGQVMGLTAKIILQSERCRVVWVERGSEGMANGADSMWLLKTNYIYDICRGCSGNNRGEMKNWCQPDGPSLMVHQ